MNAARFRAAWVQIHLWLGLTLGVLGIFIGISGSILVYDHQIDAWLNPQRYAVTGSEAALPYGEYIKRASGAVQGTAQPGNLRLPEEEGAPLIVLARAKEGGGFYRVYMDPATGKVLDVSQTGGLVGWMHGFHEHLQLREYGGRDVVGWVGVAMLISSLSGIYLWWPARGRRRQALGMRPGLPVSRNLHYLSGFYCSVVLAMLSFTGIYLAWPDAGRGSVALFSRVSAPPRNLQAPESPEGTKRISLEQAVDSAKAQYPAAVVSGIGLPNGPRGVYRVSFREGPSGPGNTIVVFLDPASGEILRKTDPSMRSGGDRFLAMQRLLHTGEAFGGMGRVVIFAVGLLPGLLVVTGTIMWLKQRRRREAIPRATATAAVSES